MIRGKVAAHIALPLNENELSKRYQRGKDGWVHSHAIVEQTNDFSVQRWGIFALPRLVTST